MRITDTMQAFLKGEATLRQDCAIQLASQWPAVTPGKLASTLALVWSAEADSWKSESNLLLSRLIGADATLDSCRFERWKANAGSGGAMPRSFRNAVLVECNFSFLDLRGARFSGAWIESSDFSGADLSGVDFSGTSLLDVDLSQTVLLGADFRTTEPGLFVRDGDKELTGNRALGFLAVRGAYVQSVDKIFMAMAHPSYDIAKKIARKLTEGGPSQLLGLTQRGVSAKNPTAAQKFIDLLTAIGYASYDRSGSARTVEVSVIGRRPLWQLVEETELDPALASFFDK